MDYQIVELQEKKVVGVSEKTSNNDPNMGEIIGGLWSKLYEGGVNEAIKNKINEFAIGIYTDYSDEGYLAMAGNEVSRTENPELTQIIIPAGKYAKFSVKGHMEKAVAAAWKEIWTMDLDRSYTVDFEEYLTCDIDNCVIDIYIALK